MAHRAGRHFLQIPGPSHLPDRISRAIDGAVIDHRGPDFSEMGLSILSGMGANFQNSVSCCDLPKFWNWGVGSLPFKRTRNWRPSVILRNWLVRDPVETNGRSVGY